MNQNSNYKYKLGMFVILGLAIFIVTIYFIGKSKNLFGSTISLNAKFKNVSGLKEGNNVRFSGIDIGTIKGIEFVSDTSVVVNFVVQQEVQKFIKTDANASIGSDGLMGDKVLTISPGSSSKKIVADNSTIKSTVAVEMEDLMKGLKKSVDNAGVITGELAIFSGKMNNNNGLLAKLMTDKQFSNSLTNTLTNLESSSSNFSTFTKKMNNKNSALSKLTSDEKLGKTVDSAVTNLNETVKAAQNNFLLKGYFNKKKKAAAKKAKAIKDSLANKTKN
jgi:phospholipid/cholesterol/gamma-HCH transport system substrate-binding protein